MFLHLLIIYDVYFLSLYFEHLLTIAKYQISRNIQKIPLQPLLQSSKLGTVSWVATKKFPQFLSKWIKRGKKTVLFSEFTMIYLQEINISHLGKRKIIFKIDFSGDMLVPRRAHQFEDDLLISFNDDFPKVPPEWLCGASVNCREKNRRKLRRLFFGPIFGWRFWCFFRGSVWGGSNLGFVILFVIFSCWSFFEDIDEQKFESKYQMYFWQKTRRTTFM